VLPLSVRSSIRLSVRPKFGVRSKILKECIDSIQIWYVDIKYQNTGQV